MKKSYKIGNVVIPEIPLPEMTQKEFTIMKIMEIAERSESFSLYVTGLTFMQWEQKFFENTCIAYGKAYLKGAYDCMKEMELKFENMYIDFSYNWHSLKEFALHYQLTESRAQIYINAGEKINKLRCNPI